MRSVYVACPAFLGPGGISGYTRRIVDVLAPESCDVLDFGRFPRLFEPPRNARLVGAPGAQAAFAARLAVDYLRRKPTWFLFAHLGLTRPLGLLPRRQGHRVSVLLHGIEGWTALSRARAAGLPRIDSFVFTTEYTRSIFLKLNGHAIRPDADTTVIPLSAESSLESMSPGPLRSDRRHRVLCVTRLTADEPLKGISTLLNAAARLDPAEWQIVVAGDGNGKAAFEQEARRLGVLDRVEFMGWVSDEARTRALLDSDVFCLPSGQEGFGIVFLEAMVAGRPCVGANAGAVPEVLTREAGELFRFGDADSLAQALQRAVSRAQVGELAPDRVRAFYDARYSWGAFNSRWKAYLARMRE